MSRRPLSENNTVVDINSRSRRAILSGALWGQVDHEPKWANSDGERLTLLVERLGDVAAADLRGHAAVEDELLQLAATAMAWIERIERERAQ